MSFKVFYFNSLNDNATNFKVTSTLKFKFFCSDGQGPVTATKAANCEFQSPLLIAHINMVNRSYFPLTITSPNYLCSQRTCTSRLEKSRIRPSSGRPPWRCWALMTTTQILCSHAKTRVQRTITH